MASDKTSGKQNLIPFKPGQSGNPAGRPKGSRNKLGEAFTDALYEDFQANGVAVIEKVRADDPAQYMRVVASLLPKEVKFESQPLADMSDDELSRLIDIIRAAVPNSVSAGDGISEEKGSGVIH